MNAAFRKLILSFFLLMVLLAGIFLSHKSSTPQKSLQEDSFVSCPLKTIDVENETPDIEKMIETCGATFKVETNRSVYFVESGNLFSSTTTHVVVLHAQEHKPSTLLVYVQKNGVLIQRLSDEDIMSELVAMHSIGALEYQGLSPNRLFNIKDINNDGFADLEIVANTSATGANTSYEVWLYNPENDTFHRYNIDNPGFDQRTGFIISRAAGVQPEYSQTYFTSQNYELIIYASFSSQYDNTTRNVLPLIEKAVNGKLQGYNLIQTSLLNAIKKDTYFTIVGDTILNYDSNHYTSISMHAEKTGDDDGEEREYFIKDLGDINQDSSNEYIVAEVVPEQYIIYHVLSVRTDGIVHLIGGVKGYGFIPFDMNVSNFLRFIEVKDITGNGKKEIITTPTGCSGNNVCDRNILTFDATNENLLPILEAAYYQKPPSPHMIFDTIERIGGDIVATGHDIDMRMKYHYSFSDNMLTLSYEEILKAHNAYDLSDGYTYQKLDKDGKIIISEERMGDNWTF